MRGARISFFFAWSVFVTDDKQSSRINRAKKRYKTEPQVTLTTNNTTARRIACSRALTLAYEYRKEGVVLEIFLPARWNGFGWMEKKASTFGLFYPSNGAVGVKIEQMSQSLHILVLLLTSDGPCQQLLRRASLSQSLLERLQLSRVETPLAPNRPPSPFPSPLPANFDAAPAAADFKASGKDTVGTRIRDSSPVEANSESGNTSGSCGTSLSVLSVWRWRNVFLPTRNLVRSRVYFSERQ